MIVIAAIVLTVGNVWFVLNRYVVHQLIEALLLYPSGRAGPKNKKDEKNKTWLHRHLLSYVQALGEYTRDALFSGRVPERARQHVSFRASAVLFIYMVGEVGLVFSYIRLRGRFSRGTSGRYALRQSSYLWLGSDRTFLPKELIGASSKRARRKTGPKIEGLGRNSSCKNGYKK